MAQLTDPETLARYKQALANWKYQGAIVLKGRAPDGLRTTLEGVTERHFKEFLYRFVCEHGGEIARSAIPMALFRLPHCDGISDDHRLHRQGQA